ncbi:MAG: DUF2840 domain-containing protein [Methylocella sp.]
MGDLTEVELYWHPGRVERWIRFGAFTRERIIDRRRRAVGFSPGSIFAYVRWAANEHGTIASRIDILRAAPPGAAISTIPGVAPGGEILLRLANWPKVQRVLQAIDTIEGLGIDPKNVAPDHWSHVHNRISAGENPRAYSRAHHRAWLLRRTIEE